jgi:selenocysteine-specific translation elongation factor
MRVRGLHAQNQAVEQAHAGQRIALNIVGDAQKEAVHRGDWLLSSPPPEPAERVIVELQCHTPLSQWQPLHIHHAASHITGRVSLLEGNLAELVLDTPLWLADNDRLVLRDISARLTLAGARVVTLDPRVAANVNRNICSGCTPWRRSALTMRRRWSCICSGMPSGLSASPGRGSSAKPEWRP